MDFLVNNIESMPNLRMTKSAVEKKTSKERPLVITKKKDQESDQVILSKFNKAHQEAIEENQKNHEATKEEEGLSQKEIRGFREKIKENQYQMAQVNNKIVYSLMTLPAFQHIKMTKAQPDAVGELKEEAINNELEELKKIQEELSQGEKMDVVLEEAIAYLMHSLVS